MTVATRTAPNYTTQAAAQYKANIDGAFSVDARIAGAFAPHEQNAGSPAPDMTVVVDAGPVFDGTTLTEMVAQTVSGFTTPSSGTVRIDRVVVDATTGVASRVAGTPQSVGSPTAVAPAIPAGKLPNCQIAFTASTTAILNSMITDERASPVAPTAATQAEQEAGSSNTVVVTPGRQHFHPSAAKAWCQATVAGALTSAAYNMTSVTDGGVGQITFTIATDFSGANWMSLVYGQIAAGGSSAGTYVTHISAIAAGTVSGVMVNMGDFQVSDPSSWMFLGFGDQA